MTIEFTYEYLFINSKFIGLHADIPLYLIAGSVALGYAVRLLRRDKDHI